MEENEQLIEEMMREAESSAEPGTLTTKQVLHSGDDEIPAPLMASELKSAGWVFIYDTKTHERSICNRNMLSQHLEKKRTDGSRVFTTTKPKQTPQRGTYKCMLHAESPDREHYDSLGLPYCRKSNLTSPFQVRRHMQKRHPMEWAAIQQEQQDRKEQRDRDFQEALVSRVVPREEPKTDTVGTPEAPLYVPDKEKRGPGRPRKQ